MTADQDGQMFRDSLGSEPQGSLRRLNNKVNEQAPHRESLEVQLRQVDPS